MNAAESLRVASAIAGMPDYSPTSVAKGMLACWDSSLTDLPYLSNGRLQQSFGWNAAEVGAFRAGCDAPIAQYEQLASRGIRVSTLLDDAVPPWQERLPGTPIAFYRGDLAILEQPAVGFSGTRETTETSISATTAIASGAVGYGMCVVSGGARGVDMAAHTAALEAGGSTVVLVPQGLATWSLPSAWRSHADRLLVMNFDQPWAEWHTPGAMLRNRVIVDLAELITIPHAGTSGGSQSTGLYALRRNRDLWVADLGDDYPGNQLLLHRGARPIPWVDGVLDIAQMRQVEASRPTQQTLF